MTILHINTFCFCSDSTMNSVLFRLVADLTDMYFITARIRRMMGGYVFKGFCLFTFWGVPPSFLMGGTPSFLMGVPPPIKTGWGYPHQNWMGVLPPQDRMGLPPIRTGWGTCLLLSRRRTFLLSNFLFHRHPFLCITMEQCTHF